MSTPRTPAAFALVFLLGACQNEGDPAGSGQHDAAVAAEARNKAALARIYDIFNTGNVDMAGDFVAVDAIEHQTMPGVTETGLAGFKQTVGMLREAFPDLHMAADQVMAEGDYVAARFTMSGTHNGPMMGMPASGKHFEISGVDIVRFADGKVAEHWGYQDDVGMMQQLGMMPEEGQPAK